MNDSKPMYFHLKHKWLPWEIVRVAEHVYQKRSCKLCNWTVKRVAVEKTR